MSPGDLSTLAETGWLAAQSASFRAWAARAGRWRQFEHGQALYQHGDPPDGLYGLASGGLGKCRKRQGDEGNSDEIT